MATNKQTEKKDGVFDSIKKVFTGGAEKATAPQTGKETAEKAPFKNKRPGLKRITITGPVAGKYLLPWNVGQTVFHDAKQADEMIANGDAKLAE